MQTETIKTKISSLRKKGLSFSQIASNLNEEGLTTKTGKKFTTHNVTSLMRIKTKKKEKRTYTKSKKTTVPVIDIVTRSILINQQLNSEEIVEALRSLYHV